MSSRTLSAYFNDYRQGKKDFDLLRDFLLDAFGRDPLRRGHLLNWLDQAQYEHPIPVTDFLLLRKEVEMALKAEPEQASTADATLINDGSDLVARRGTGSNPAAQEQTMLPGQATLTAGGNAPGQDATLMANPDATLLANPDATVLANAGSANLAAANISTGTDVTRIAPRPVDSGDYTPIPERSDHAGVHEAATSFDPRRQPTLTVPVTPPAPPRASRVPLVVGGSVLTLLAALGGTVALQLWPATQASVSTNTTDAVNQLNKESPTSSIGSSSVAATLVPVAASASASDTPLDNPATTAEDSPPAPALDSLDASSLLTLVQERISLGLLLPDDDPATAHGAMRELEKRFADSDQLLTARKQLKDAHLKLSDQARADGRWEAAQQHLDAAFNVLQPPALSATAPSAGS